jgi:hypothetical protein
MTYDENPVKKTTEISLYLDVSRIIFPSSGRKRTIQLNKKLFKTSLKKMK